MIATKVATSGALDKIAQEWRMPKELAGDLVGQKPLTCQNTHMKTGIGQALVVRHRAIHRRLGIDGIRRRRGTD